MTDGIIESLERWVLQDGKPITARLLSVQHNIPIHLARQHMLTFLQQASSASDAKPYAMWILHGRLAKGAAKVPQVSLLQSGDAEEETAEAAAEIAPDAVLLADDEQLEGVKARFASPPSVSLYALTAPTAEEPKKTHQAAAASQLVTIQHDLKSTPKYVKVWDESERGVKLGAIRPASDVVYSSKTSNKLATSVETVEKTAPKAKAALALATVKAEPLPTVKPAASVPAASRTIKASEQKTSKEVKPKVKAKPKKKVSSNEKDEAEDDDESEDDDDDDDSMDEGEESDDASVPSDGDESQAAPPSSVKGSAAHKRADAGLKMSKQEESRRRLKQQLMDMMSEDEDGKADPEVPAADRTATSMMQGNNGSSSSRKPSAKTTEMKSKKKAVDKPSNEPRENSAEKPEKPAEKQRVRKQRAVIRKEQTKNEKGYRITKDVEHYESYSSFESSEEERPKGKGKGSKKAAVGKALMKKEAASKPTMAVKANSASPSERKQKDGGRAAGSGIPGKASPSPPPPPPTAAQASASDKAATSAKKSSNGGSGAKPSGGQQTLSSFFKKKT